MPENSPLFSLQDVTYHYDESAPAALNAINLQITPAETLVLLGSNGSGKSTLLKILDGLYYATSGKVEFEGQTLSEASFKDDAFTYAFRSRVGFVFQESDAQLFMPNVEDELAFAPLQMELSDDEVRSRVEKALQELHLEPLRERAPHQLSGGEKKKVALASILTLQPDVWLLDEPTAGLDPRSSAWLSEFLHQLKRSGKTVVLATHDLALTRAVADRVYLLSEEHSLLAEGSAEDVLANESLLKEANLI
jgi:cobalt/nickel transport system ATP-binding protein